MSSGILRVFIQHWNYFSMRALLEQKRQARITDLTSTIEEKTASGSQFWSF